jgi:hypothetical protein
VVFAASTRFGSPNTDDLSVSDVPSDSFPDFDRWQPSPVIEWLWRIPLLLRWDGVFPFLSPVTVLTLSVLQVPAGLLALLGVLVPICVALGRAGLAQREILRVCGDHGSLDRHLALAIAIILLLVLEILSTMLIAMNARLASWAPVALLYAGYIGFIAFALRPARKTGLNDDPFGDRAALREFK